MAPIRTSDQSYTGATGLGWSSRGSQVTKLDPCAVCGKVLSRLHDMKRHVASHTPKTMRCTFSAECPYIGRSESSLKAHIRRHTQEKPHACEDDIEKCQYASTDAAGLLRHRVTHHGYKPRRVHRTRTRANRVPVSVMSQLRDNGDEAAIEGFRVFRAGKNAANTDQVLCQPDSSSNENKAPRFYSGYASATPSAPSANNSMPYYVTSEGNFYLPQMSPLDAALATYPFSDQLNAVPPFSNAYPADQSMLSFQGWNTEPKVKLEVIEQEKFEVPGQGTQDLFSFSTQNEGNYMRAGPSNAIQLDVVAPQPAVDFTEYLNYPTNEFGHIDFSTLANQSYLETQPVEGLQSVSVDLESNDWMFNNNNVHPSTTLDNFGNPINFDLPSVNDNTPSFGQVYEFDSHFSGEMALDNFNFSGNYTNTYQTNIQSY